VTICSRTEAASRESNRLQLALMAQISVNSYNDLLFAYFFRALLQPASRSAKTVE
jgi:hypothetical protein